MSIYLHLLDFIGWLGYRFKTVTYYLVDLAYFIADSLWDTRGRRFYNRANWRSLSTQLIFSGIDSLPVMSLIAIVIGISITSQVVHFTSNFTYQVNIINYLIYLIGFEIASLLTAFVLISRSGSAIIVNLGRMKVDGEIEGLELLAMNVNHFFILPRLLALSVSQLALATLFAGIALYGGIFMASLLYSPNYIGLSTGIASSVPVTLLIVFVIKNLLFGLLIAGIACFHGMRVRDGVNDLPKQTQLSLVNSVILVFLTDTVFALALQSMGLVG